MALGKFWLLNGSKKKGKKSAKKVAKRITKKVAKKVSRKVVRKPTMVSRARKSVWERPTISVFKARPVSSLPENLMTVEEKIKFKNRGVKPMAKRKRVKRSVAKATTKKFVPQKPKRATIGSKHRITTYWDKGGALKTSRKSKITKRGLKVNPFKFSAKGIVNQLTPAVVLSASSVGTIIGLNKVMPKIPYVNTIQNSYAKAGLKIVLGLIGSMAFKKVFKTKNNNIANGILIGSVIGAMTDFVNISDTTAVNGIKLNGCKVLGNVLDFGRPKTVLANPNFQMNGIKIPANTNMSAIKFAKNYNANNTVAGVSEERW